MKKFFLLSPVLLAAFFVQAQSYDNIKSSLLFQQYKKAKEDIDKAMTNAKFISKAEAYILKASVYAGLAMEPAVKGTPAGEQFLKEADAALTKYQKMDPELSLMYDIVYQGGWINIYSALYSSGYKDYEDKKWQPGFQKFKKVVAYSDLMISKKIITVAADTNSLLLAGLTAENAGLKDDAVKYYGRIADLKVDGAGFEDIYRFLVNHYAAKNDMVNFEKYKAYGKALYPGNQFFQYDKVDFAIGLEEDLNKRVKALENITAADPNNYKAAAMLGEIIYDTLNSRKQGAIQPVNAAELEAKMIRTFYRAIALNPGDPLPLVYIGDHFINRSITVNEEREVHAAVMRKRIQPGTAVSKQDVAKKNALDTKYLTALEAAREPYEKAAAVFAKKEKLTAQDKQQFKKIASYLADIYAAKRIKATGNAADLAKYTAEENKWIDIYNSIK